LLISLFVLVISMLTMQTPPTALGASVKQADLLGLKMVESRQDELFPSSRDYIAMLTNDGGRPVSIEAVQMPGGYAGSGRFYACSVQFWKASNKKWVTPRPAKLLDFGQKPPPIVQVELKPGERLGVCNSLLPQQQGHAGDSVRFALSLHWGQKPTLFSNRFTIAGDSKGKDH
jgi:hypothetical protein